MRILRHLKTPTATWTSRGVLAAVFFAYGASKIPQLSAFAASIHNYRILPVQLENPLAITLPWIEVFSAIALLRRRWLPGGLTVITALLVVFLAAIISAIVRGLDINCGCFIADEDSAASGNLWRHLFYDILLLVLAVHLWWVTATRSEDRT